MNQHRLHFLMLFLVIIITISNSIDGVLAEEFSYTQKLKFATLVEENIGHVIAAYDNLNKGDQEGLEFAKIHLLHAYEENAEDMKEFLKVYEDFEEQYELFLYVLPYTDIRDEEKFEEQLQKFLQINYHGEKLVVGDLLQDDIFNLLLVNSLLEYSKAEILDSQGLDHPEQSIEMQDSFALTVRAHMIFSDINGLEQKNVRSVTADFIKVFDAYGRDVPKSELITLENNIINKINHIILEKKPQFVIPNVKQSANEDEPLILLESTKFFGKYLVSLYGENFGRNERVTIERVTDDFKDSKTISLVTTDEGKFYQPLEFNQRFDGVYHLNIKSQDIELKKTVTLRAER